MPELRFVILEHTHQGLHFDLMLEVEGKLRTWRLEFPPEAGQVQRAEASFDHRLLYLDYEGPISGDRGNVRRWDRGVYVGDARGDREVDVTVQSQRLAGRLVLRHLAGSEWELHYYPSDHPRKWW